MATKFAYKRLTKEYMNIMKSPPPFIIAKPLESNILEWYNKNYIYKYIIFFIFLLDFIKKYLFNVFNY